MGEPEGKTSDLGGNGLPDSTPLAGSAPTARAGERLPLVRLAILFYGGVAAAALIWNELAGASTWFADAGSAARGVWWTRDLAVGFATAAVVIALSQFVTLRTRRGESLARALGQVLGPLSWRECLVLAAVSSFAEEAFFRGALQPRIGYVAASLLFGLAHFAPQPALRPWTLFAIAAGFLLGGLYAWTGNLAAPIVAHFGINAINLRLLATRYAVGSAPTRS